MAHQDEQNDDNRLIRFFAKHLVPIFFTFAKDTDSHSAIVTSFVLSVGEQWFLITAGHCIEQITELVTVRGYKITKCLLIDSLGLDARHYDPIPFDYGRSQPTHANDHDNFDYGIITLSLYYRQLLERNNIQPLNEEVWKLQPSKVDFYTLLGVPSELVKVVDANIEFAPTLFQVTQLTARPSGFSETDMPLFYGRVELGHRITSIQGMSGGPIFAFKQDSQGQLKYWLTALQSRWLPDSHYIAACPTKLLGDILETMHSKP